MLRHLVGAEDGVELDDAVERLRLPESRLGVEPDLVQRANLGALAGLEVDQRPGQLALGHQVEHGAFAGRGQGPVEHRATGSVARRPEGDDARDHGHERGDGGEPVRPPERTAIELGVAEDAVPVARALVARHQRVEELGHVGHALTSFSFVCRFEWAACKVADTVPREMPSASAIPA